MTDDIVTRLRKQVARAEVDGVLPSWDFAKVVWEAADEIERLHSLVSELLPYMLNDMEQGLLIAEPPFQEDHCKNSLVPCPDCTWLQDATLWKKRIDAGEFKDYNI